MSYLINQLTFVRNNTVKAVKGTSEELADIVPTGFNNSLRWNLGHIYLVHERFAFSFIEEDSQLSEDFVKWFSPGTKPADWDSAPPNVETLVTMLEEQIERIERLLSERLEEKVKEPYTTSSGLRLSSVEEFLSFCLYHEGMHFDAIKTIKRLVKVEG
ncbi:DinB family protein [Halalkalibacterium ligniniphilum]|uniref:DinB family protein n=1 Tax=Halalkalibacterium ligniniphilum TaxID=1134413 RepID=UPI00034D728D|nr:DinB family protein [Halalkalibacterium ligniniphilum]